MKTIEIIAVVVATFAVVQLTHAQTTTPKAPAPRFEQLCDKVPEGQLTAVAQARGKEGYELVSVVSIMQRVQQSVTSYNVTEDVVMCFKRALP